MLCFPDFLNEEARRWFGEKYKILLDYGIDGFWNDMNEPAIFYTEDHLKEVFLQLKDYEGKNLDIRSFFNMQGIVGGLANNPDDYKRFYHEYKGKRYRHDKVHNLFGYNMTRAAGEAFERLSPDKRILMFSRSSYIGMHRYGGVWCGDNKSWWSHLLLNIQQMPALNMCGFLYSGADVGGFGADVTEDLLMRWTEFGIFTPLFRNHSAEGTRRQELYRFSDTESFKNIVNLRYSFIPYLYSEFMKAVNSDGMLFTPPAFEYPDDDMAYEVEDQLFVGDSIMIAPVYRQNATGRYVYLPEEMKLCRFRSYDDYDVKIIDRGAFSNSKYLSEVKIGKNVAEIKESAFINCINIKHIYIPNSVKKMKRCGLGIQKRIACEYSENEAECFYETITGFKIYGKKGSAGEEYCNNRKNYFVPAEYGNSLNNYSFENLTFVETPLKAKPSLKVKGKKGKATLTLKNYFIEGGAYSYSDYQISIVKGKKNYGESFNNYRKGIKAVNGKLIYTLKLPKGRYKIRYRASFYVSGRKLKTKWSKTKTVVVR